jgi:hypothetical protein
MGLDTFGDDAVKEAFGTVDEQAGNMGYDPETGMLVESGAEAKSEPETKSASPVAKEQDKPETKQEQKASVFDSILPKNEEEEQAVPIHVVKKLREEKRQLKAQLEQLQTRPAAEKADVTTDLLGEGDDDDLLTRAELKQVLAKQDEMFQKKISETIQSHSLPERQAQMARRAAVSEAAAKQKYKDFEAAIVTANKAHLLTQDDFKEALESENPAEVLYGKAKSVLDGLGVYFGLSKEVKQKPEPETKTEIPDKKETPSEQEDPEKVFEEFFGKTG